MHLKLVISLALCHTGWGRAPPQRARGTAAGGDAGLQQALHGLNLLNQLQLQLGDAIVVDDSQEGKPKNKRPAIATIASLPTLSVGKPQKVYSSDGPFSDIPSDAFRLERRKEFRLKDGYQGRLANKDLTGPAPLVPLPPLAPKERVPENLIGTCLDYFQGRSHPKQSSLELILDICSELLDDDGVEHFALDDEKRQKMYDFRANEDGTHRHQLGPGVSVECEFCPYGHHVMKSSALAAREDEDDGDDDDDEDGTSDGLLRDLLELFKPIGYRREWMVVNSQNPDERMKAYVDLKK